MCSQHTSVNLIVQLNHQWLRQKLKEHNVILNKASSLLLDSETGVPGDPHGQLCRHGLDSKKTAEHGEILLFLNADELEASHRSGDAADESCRHDETEDQRQNFVPMLGEIGRHHRWFTNKARHGPMQRHGVLQTQHLVVVIRLRKPAIVVLHGPQLVPETRDDMRDDNDAECALHNVHQQHDLLRKDSLSEHVHYSRKLQEPCQAYHSQYPESTQHFAYARSAQEAGGGSYHDLNPISEDEQKIKR
mmetsp:Transcript_41927/g.77981  ORF Transcript_41927/g.77981 Transcript_41927/m.77981 type:complete len:247 (-) Transcript_41927:524-1264(-)